MADGSTATRPPKTRYDRMTRKKTIGLVVLLAVAAGAWYAYRQYTRTNKDLLHVTADIRQPATGLIADYEQDDSSANKKYLGKVVEVSGPVKEVKKDEAGYITVVLGETNSLSSVRCAMDTTHQQDAASLAAGTPATIRGACTGFNKDEMGLGSDVILNRCVIVANKNQP